MFRRGRGRGMGAAPQQTTTVVSTTTQPAQPARTTTTVTTVQRAPTNTLDVMFVSYGSSFKKHWDDRKTGAKPYQLALWTPIAPEGYYALGSYAERSHNDYPAGGACVGVVRDPGTASVPLLAAPTSFLKVWTDKGTGGKYGNCSLWQPVAPPGYVALGFVANKGYDPPSVDVMRCVHTSAVHPGTMPGEPKDGDYIWCDRKSGAKKGDVSIWAVRPSGSGSDMGTFVCSADYNRPNFPVYVINEGRRAAPPARPAASTRPSTTTATTTTTSSASVTVVDASKPPKSCNTTSVTVVDASKSNTTNVTVVDASKPPAGRGRGRGRGGASSVTVVDTKPSAQPVQVPPPQAYPQQQAYPPQQQAYPPQQQAYPPQQQAYPPQQQAYPPQQQQYPPQGYPPQGYPPQQQGYPPQQQAYPPQQQGYPPQQAYPPQQQQPTTVVYQTAPPPQATTVTVVQPKPQPTTVVVGGGRGRGMRGRGRGGATVVVVDKRR